MSNDAKKISSLAIATTLSANDRVVVLTNPASSPSVRTITVNNLTSSIRYANTTAAGVVKVGNNLSVNSTGFLNSSGIGDFTFSDHIITTPTYAEIRTPNTANNKYAISYYDDAGSWGGYTQLDKPEGNSSWAWVGTDITDIDNPWVVLEVRADDGSYTTWKFDSDLKRNGVSVIGTGQIDGGNAFTSPTAEITVDGGGA